MGLRGGILLVFLGGLAGGGPALAQGVDPGDFSLDGFSRIEVPSPFHAADLIDKAGSTIHIPHGRLGMPDDPVAIQSDIDAFSYGKDKLVPAGPNAAASADSSRIDHGSTGHTPAATNPIAMARLPAASAPKTVQRCRVSSELWRRATTVAASGVGRLAVTDIAGRKRRRDPNVAPGAEREILAWNGPATAPAPAPGR